MAKSLYRRMYGSMSNVSMYVRMHVCTFVRLPGPRPRKLCSYRYLIFTGTHRSPGKNNVFFRLITLCTFRFWCPPEVPVKQQKMMTNLQLFLQKCIISGTSN